MGILHAQQTGALDSRIPGGVQPRMRIQQATRAGAASAFNHQNGFIARGATRGGDKAPGVAQVFQIKQNGAGFTVASQIIEQFVDIDIQTVA